MIVKVLALLVAAIVIVAVGYMFANRPKPVQRFESMSACQAELARLATEFRADDKDSERKVTIGDGRLQIVTKPDMAIEEYQYDTWTCRKGALFHQKQTVSVGYVGTAGKD